MIKSAQRESENGLPWINPVGGLGDQLMLSGVLKLAHDQDPTKRYNLVRRTNYTAILGGHPAIATVGHPPKDAEVLGVDYWGMEPLGPGPQRAFQVLARSFGVEMPAEERLYVPGGVERDEFLESIIPWKSHNVLIAPASDSPRKVLHPMAWHRLVDLLHQSGFFVAQVGRLRDLRIRNAYSLLGLTTPRQLIGLLPRADVVVTLDSFILHACHLVGAPTVAIWGATRNQVYGYPGQTHIQMPRMCQLGPDEDCIDTARNRDGTVYGTPCPMGEKHCIDQVRIESIVDAVKEKLVSGKQRSAGALTT